MASESSVQTHIRLAAANDGVFLLRNNSGALKDQNGRLIRFGLGNESQATNRMFKSGDLIGIRPLLIEQKHVGTYVGQFLSVEVKKPGARTSGDHYAAQVRWAELVKQWGGSAGIADTVGSARMIWGKSSYV